MTSADALSRFVREVPAGEIVFREGEGGDVMFVLQQGRIRILKRVANGERVLATLGPGEFFGEMAILSGNPRTATAVVTEDGPARVLVIDAKRFEAMIANNREITLRLIKKLASRLESADALIEILMHKDPKARVMRALSRHAEAFGEETPEGRRVALTPAELAAQVNVDDETVEEVLGRLKRVRVVSVEASGTLIVHDVDRLLDFLEFLEMPQKFGGDPS
ncbi:MAG: Crp/Fnr family transcriptional regulator [Polyangiales bacterium]